MELIMLSISGSLALLIAEMLEQLPGLRRHVAEPHARSDGFGNRQYEGWPSGSSGARVFQSSPAVQRNS